MTMKIPPWVLAVVSGVVQAAALLSGVWAGLRAESFFTFTLCSWVALLMAVAGLLLMLAGAISKTVSVAGHRKSAWAVFLYALVLFALNAVWLTAVWWGLWLFDALLVPMVVLGVLCLRRGQWLTLGGVALFLFSSAFAATFNVEAVAGGIGYWAGWLV